MQIDLPFYGKDTQIQSLVEAVRKRIRVVYGDDCDAHLLNITIHDG